MTVHPRVVLVGAAVALSLSFSALAKDTDGWIFPCGAAASGVAGTAAAGAASALSYRSSVLRISGIDTERHDGEWQCRGASMRTRCRPTTNENEWPA